jgi:cytochrome c-type biogenesis protein CcmH/NrfF
MLALVTFYLWVGPVLVALIFGYVTYHIYKGYREKPKH